MEHNLPIRQTVKLRYIGAVEYCTYRFNDWSPRNKVPVFHRIPKIMKKLRSQKMTHTFGRADSGSILGFLTTFKLACDASCLHENATIRTMPSFVADRVVSSLNSRMVQSDLAESLDTAVNSNEDPLQAPSFRSYSEVVNHLPKRYAIDKAFAAADATILRFSQSAGMVSLQHGEALFAKAFRVGDVYDECILNDTFIEGGDSSIRYSLRYNLSTHPPTDLIGLAFQAQSLFAL